MSVNYTLGGEQWPPSTIEHYDAELYGMSVAGTNDWSSYPWYAIGGPKLIDFIGPDHRMRVEVILSIYEVLPGRGGRYIRSNPVLWQDTLSATWPPE